jgi:hypothetical protein
VGKSEGKKPLGRHTHRSENNIKVDFHETGRDMGWINLAKNRDKLRILVNMDMNLRAP